MIGAVPNDNPLSSEWRQLHADDSGALSLPSFDGEGAPMSWLDSIPMCNAASYWDGTECVPLSTSVSDTGVDNIPVREELAARAFAWLPATLAGGAAYWLLGGFKSKRNRGRNLLYSTSFGIGIGFVVPALAARGFSPLAGARFVGKSDHSTRRGHRRKSGAEFGRASHDMPRGLLKKTGGAGGA